jgi:cell division septum initiation protein DivIVA
VSKEFKINRKNLSEIKRLKEQVKELKAEAPTLTSKEQAPTEAQPAPAAEAAAAAAAPAPAAKPKKKRVVGGTAEGNALRYKKRVDLNDTEPKFLSEWFNKTGFGGRGVLHKQIQKHYNDNDTPQKERISRRRMWHWLKKQEVFIEFTTNTLLCKSDTTGDIRKDLNNFNVKKPPQTKVHQNKAKRNITPIH